MAKPVQSNRKPLFRFQRAVLMAVFLRQAQRELRQAFYCATQVHADTRTLPTHSIFSFCTFARLKLLAHVAALSILEIFELAGSLSHLILDPLAITSTFPNLAI